MKMCKDDEFERIRAKIGGVGTSDLDFKTLFDHKGKLGSSHLKRKDLLSWTYDIEKKFGNSARGMVYARHWQENLEKYLSK